MKDVLLFTASGLLIVITAFFYWKIKIDRWRNNYKKIKQGREKLQEIKRDIENASIDK